MDTTRVRALFESELAVVNLGLASFAVNLRRSGAKAINVDWRPAGGGDPVVQAALDRCLDEHGGVRAEIAAATRQSVERLLQAKPAAEPEARAPVAPAASLDIKFGPNTAVLTPEAKEVIKQLGTAMASEQLSTFRFQIEGHTDTSGRKDRNMALSKERAMAVRSYLIANYGIKPDRLVTVGRGPDAPIDPANPTSAVNRRVQIVNLGQ